MEYRVWGLVDKGINDKLEVWLGIPCEITQTSKDMGMCSDSELKKNVKRGYAQFNLDATKARIHNEIMICELCRQDTARGQEIVLENTQVWS